MSIFVDTSAFYAIFDANDQDHQAARATWSHLLEQDEVLTTSNYVLVETFALLQRRRGIEPVRLFHDVVMPILQILWVDVSVHELAVATWLTAGRRQLSLVDCVSFVLMRQHSIQASFAFDQHFTEQGLPVIP